jgi:hypothetical protein
MMTANQWRLLEVLENWGGHGTIEVELQWGGYDFGESEAEEAKAFRTTRLVVASLVRSLVRRGYATNDGCYDITDAGRASLERRRRQAGRVLPTEDL